MLPKGRYRAKAVDAQLGFSPNKGTEQVVVEFEILDEEHAGERITWIGYFAENTSERTIESLRICGWKTDDVSDLRGIGDNEVQLVVEHEPYQGKTFARVQFVNRIGGINMKSP